MTKNYKILAEFIKDMSCETQDVETFLFVGRDGCNCSTTTNNECQVDYNS